jgi:hypothetical protein
VSPSESIKDRVDVGLMTEDPLTGHMPHLFGSPGVVSPFFLEVWLERIPKLSVLNLEKSGMGDQMGSSLLEGKSQSPKFA